jgi:hypothetical protein
VLRGNSATSRRSILQAPVGSVANTFETGLALGTPITIANSSLGTAGDAISFVDQGNGAGGVGCSVVYDNAHVMHGTRSLKFTQGSTPGTPTVSWDFASPQTTAYGRFYYYADAHPSASVHVLNFWTGTADGGYIDIDPTLGTISILDSAFVNRATSGFGVHLGIWNRIEWKYVAGTSTGTVSVKLFIEDGTTEVGSFTSSNGNFGAQVSGVGQFMNATAANHVYWIDDIQRNAVAFSGPAASSSWVTTADTDFITDGVLPAPWQAYNFANSIAAAGYYRADHVVIAGGTCKLRNFYEATGPGTGTGYGASGQGFYTAAIYANSLAANDYRTTVRMRVTTATTAGFKGSHRNLPLWYVFPDPSALGGWPRGGEEDLNESDPIWTPPDVNGKARPDVYTHFYNDTSTSIGGAPVPGPDQNFTTWGRVDMSQWHVYRTQRLGNTITGWLDDMNTPLWTATYGKVPGSPGNLDRLPVAPKKPVFQVENANFAVPTGTTGSEDIEIDWIRVDVPAP